MSIWSTLNTNTYFRKTIRSSFSLEGRGIHKNEFSKLNFYPARSGTGIVFKKTKESGDQVTIPALVDYINSTYLSITISRSGENIQTIEHLMSAIYMMGITDMTIEIQNGSEIPILDGSALPFIEALETAKVNWVTALHLALILL